MNQEDEVEPTWNPLDRKSSFSTSLGRRSVDHPKVYRQKDPKYKTMWLTAFLLKHDFRINALAKASAKSRVINVFVLDQRGPNNNTGDHDNKGDRATALSIGVLATCGI